MVMSELGTRVHLVQGCIGYKHSSHSSWGQVSLGLFCQSGAKNLLISKDTARVTIQQEGDERLHAAYIKRGSTIHHAPLAMKGVLRHGLVKRRRNTEMFYLSQFNSYWKWLKFTNIFLIRNLFKKRKKSAVKT